MPWLCDGFGKYPTRVWEEYVALTDRGTVLYRTNDLGAAQFGLTEKRLFGMCSVCRSSGYQIANDGTVRVHHRFD
ncbi:hypothetical protein AB0A63_13860 [Lentzea sp. NPDC042327]|uniref:hypothetical protein n=1 Tax=Lentzea sp. NPDC042327 TaxID=3154801 RepID=UPI0033C03454